MHIPKPNDVQFEMPPAGTHLAVCYRVIDLGTQSTIYMGQTKRQHKILVSWELPEEKMGDGRPFTIGQRYTWSMSEKAKLRHDLESWRGTPFTERDFGTFDIKNLLGKACLLNVVHVSKEGTSYANIASISRLMKGQQGPSKTENPHAYLWINQDRFDSDVFAKLSDKMKATIMQSPEYSAFMNNGPQEAEATSDEDLNDPIPF